jgi:hypothetical protein
MSIGYMDPFVVAAQGNTVELYTPYFLHGTKIVSKLHDFSSSR